MNRLAAILVSIMTALVLFGCTADYDTFGTSDYKVFNNIVFEEQDGTSSVYEEEHQIKVTLKEPKKDTWDSITIEKINISSLASLHLVDGKFKEFPSDSAALDSLANHVSYVDDDLREGDKIRIPASLKVYLMVVSESGLPSIWQLSFTIPGVEASSSSQKDSDDGKDEDKDDGKDDEGDDGDDSSDDAKSSSSKAKDDSVESSSSEEEPESSSSVILNSAKDLQLTFDDQLKSNRSGDTIYVKLNNGTELSAAKLSKSVISEGASADPDPAKVESWKEPQSIKVTAEDGSSKTWIVVLSVAEADEKASSDKDLESISAANESNAATIDAEKKIVTLHFDSKAAAGEAVVSLKASSSATHNLSSDKINLLDTLKFTITAEDGSADEWKLVADYPPPAPAPRIISMKIDGHDAVVDSVKENGKLVYWVHYDSLDFLTDLSKLKVSDIKLTEYAEVSGIKDGSSYDLGMGVDATVKNRDGVSLKYVIRAGYQLPGSDFNSWSSNDVTPDSVWGNANTILTTTSKYSSGGVVGAQIKTGEALGKTASGSLYTADFNPNGVGTLSMASSSTWPDGNELLDFGKKFRARPAYMDVTFSYSGSGDSCDVYILLENRTGDKNKNRSSSDVNTLVASAWYRSTTADNTGRENPDVLSVKDAAVSGFKTIRLKLKYGTPYESSAINNSSTFTTKLSSKESKAINNGVVQGTGEESVTHVRVVFASSADGNHYNGKKNATLIIDEMKLIY